MANEADKVLASFLKKIQQNAKIRKVLAVALLFLLLGIAAYFVYQILPRNYAITITGGDILSNRHYLAKTLQEEVASNGVSVELIPTSGSQEALAMIQDGKLDMAFIQGGLDVPYTNVRHVATVAPELLHFLIKRPLRPNATSNALNQKQNYAETKNDVAILRGKRINLGTKKGGTRIIAKQVLAYSGLEEGIDYVESNIPTEELMSMRVERLPDAIVITSFVPSDVVDYLVKQRDYDLLELPFPASLALRLGWVADTRILAYMYNVTPAVPTRDIKTVGVNLHLVANKNVDPRAIYKVLESLFSPALEVRLKIKIDEKDMLIPSGYELSEGSKVFMDRKTPLFSNATLDKIKSLFGLILSVGSTLLVIFKWFRGDAEPTPPPTEDKFFTNCLERILALEKEYLVLQAQAALTREIIQTFQDKISAINIEALARLPNARFDNPQLPNHLLMAIRDARDFMSA